MMRIVVSTCREPSRRIRSFSNELAKALPEAIRVNRGKFPLKELARIALDFGAYALILIGSFKGNPGKIVIYRIEELRYYKIPPTIYIKGVKLLREMHKKSPLPIVKSLFVICKEDEPDFVKEFSETLASAIKMPYLEISNFKEVLESVDVLLLTSYMHRGYLVIEFLNGRDLKPAGPLIRIRRVQ